MAPVTVAMCGVPAPTARGRVGRAREVRWRWRARAGASGGPRGGAAPDNTRDAAKERLSALFAAEAYEATVRLRAAEASVWISEWKGRRRRELREQEAAEAARLAEAAAKAVVAAESTARKLRVADANAWISAWRTRRGVEAALAARSASRNAAQESLAAKRDAALAAGLRPAREDEQVAAEFEPEPVVAKPEPEPVVARPEPEPEPEPEPVPEAAAAPAAPAAAAPPDEARDDAVEAPEPEPVRTPAAADAEEWIAAWRDNDDVLAARRANAQETLAAARDAATSAEPEAAPRDDDDVESAEPEPALVVGRAALVAGLAAAVAAAVLPRVGAEREATLTGVGGRAAAEKDAADAAAKEAARAAQEAAARARARQEAEAAQLRARAEAEAAARREKERRDAESARRSADVFVIGAAGAAAFLALQGQGGRRSGRRTKRGPPARTGAEPRLGTTSATPVRVAVASIPHPEKAATGGEDAYFVVDAAEDSGASFGIADGVGGWALDGVDPAAYARLFCERCAEVAAVVTDPREMIDTAHWTTDVIGGAAVITASVGDGVVRVASLGDCSVLQVRDGGAVYQTPVKQHSFNCPYQLSYPDLEEGTDYAEDAEVFDIAVQPGDVLVMGSDGVFDNVFPAEVAALCAGAAADPSRAADAVARRARSNSLDAGFDSPFAREYRAALRRGPEWRRTMSPDGPGDEFTGGKLDDVTVVVAVVDEAPTKTKTKTRTTTTTTTTTR